MRRLSLVASNHGNLFWNSLKYKILVFLFTLSACIITSLFHLSGPFRATQIWNEIIDHLKSRVELKRRRMKMKTYENCFTGQDTVDVVLTYLLSEKNTFSSDLSREKAIKV